jgi:hypothetical protein
MMNEILFIANERRTMTTRNAIEHAIDRIIDRDHITRNDIACVRTLRMIAQQQINDDRAHDEHVNTMCDLIDTYVFG